MLGSAVGVAEGVAVLVVQGAAVVGFDGPLDASSIAHRPMARGPYGGF